MLSVGDIIKGKAIDIDFKGQGVVRHDNYVIFVRGMIDGEEAEIKITKLKKSFGQGEISKLIVQSDDRVIDSNTQFGSCNLIHLSVARQLAWQKRITQDTIKKISGVEYELKDTLTDYKDRFYRNKVVFHIIDTPYLTLGLYNSSSSELIGIDNFVLANKKVNEIIQYLATNKMVINPRVFKYIVFRTNSKNEVLITLVAKKELFLGREELVNKLKSIKDVIGITLNINDSDRSILGKKSFVIFGKNAIAEKLNGIDVYMNDRSFFQINLPVIKKAYQLISDEIKPDKTIIDAYSGVGSIGFYLANKAKKVVLIEANKTSAKMAAKTIGNSNLTNVEIIDELAEKVIHLIGADYLIVDPPRSGLKQGFIDGALQQGYEKMFYLSCDVKTLSRDIALLSSGYEVENIYPLRMFFHTTSLETLVIMNKK